MKRGSGRWRMQEDEMEAVTVVGMEGQGEGSIDLLPDACVQRDGTGETHCTFSWIWTTMPIDLVDGKNDNIL
jgi:hypothetical protein